MPMPMPARPMQCTALVATVFRSREMPCRLQLTMTAARDWLCLTPVDRQVRPSVSRVCLFMLGICRLCLARA